MLRTTSLAALLLASFAAPASALNTEPVVATPNTEPVVAKSSDSDSEAGQGILPIPDYSGDWYENSKLTGDWGGLRQDWASRGFTFGLDWLQVYQDITDGGSREGTESSTNLDLRLSLDLMRMDLVPGALVNVRVESRFGNTVNARSGLLLPVNSAGYFPFALDQDGDVDLAITELNWLQFLSENVGVLLGKITTMVAANEFMGGEGRSQFMNFQFIYSPVLAQVTPYSALAAGLVLLPSSNLTFTSLVMNLSDTPETSGFDEIGDGGVWWNGLDYRTSFNDLPGGGTFSFYYAYDAEFAQIGGLNIDPGTGLNLSSQSNAWAASWSGWQYLCTENGETEVDPLNGRQDLQGLGTFAQVGFGDKDTNPTSWSVSGGFSGRGSIPTRDDDTWGVAYFYNDLQDLNLGPLQLEGQSTGFEVYYNIALTGSVALTLDVQWTESALPNVEDTTIFGTRLSTSL